MFKRILVASDGSELSHKAVGTAVQLARALEAVLVGFSATPPQTPAGLSEFQPHATAQRHQSPASDANGALAHIEAAARAAGVTSECVSTETAEPWRGILATAHDRHCDLIVMASHGHQGLGALLVGSETQHVLTHGTLPVLVVR